MNELIKNSEAMKELKKVIDTNSKFLCHIKDNVVEEKGFFYYLGSQGYWKKRYSSESEDFSSLSCLSKRYNDVYCDTVFSLKELEKIEEYKEIRPSWSSQPNKNTSNLIIEDKTALLGIMFSRNTDNRFIELICKNENFSPNSLEKIKENDIEKLIEWMVKKINKIQIISEENKYPAINEKDLIIVVNNDIWNKAISKEILGKLNLKYFENFKIISLPLKDNFQCVILNKRSLGCSYELLNDVKEERYRKIDEFNNSEFFCLHMDSKLFFFPFVNSYALLKGN